MSASCLLPFLSTVPGPYSIVHLYYFIHCSLCAKKFDEKDDDNDDDNNYSDDGDDWHVKLAVLFAYRHILFVYSCCILRLYHVQNTALHYACFGGHVEAVQLLLEYKADVAVKNTHSQSPLDHAIDNVNSDVVMVMLRNKR